MTRTKSSQLVSAGVIFLSIMLFSGCATFDNLLNPTFLNTEQPFGQTTLNTVQGKGPVTIVLENLTAEARHQEYAFINIFYIDEQGNTLGVGVGLKAVPEAQRNPASANYDSSFREVIVLDCGIKELWFSGIVYRTRIETKTQTIVLGNQQSQDITFGTAAITRIPSDLAVAATSMTSLQFDSFLAPQFVSSHLLQTTHFSCGDVVLVGLLDQQTQNSMIDLQQYTSQYTDLNSLSNTFATTNSNLFPSPPSQRFIFDPTYAELMGEYQYPAGYTVIPLVLSNMVDVDQALGTLKQIAAQNAAR
ncbi:MAG: hypothetical protein WC975_15985 [Phycisphaerae bacterium]